MRTVGQTRPIPFFWEEVARAEGAGHSPGRAPRLAPGSCSCCTVHSLPSPSRQPTARPLPSGQVSSTWAGRCREHRGAPRGPHGGDHLLHRALSLSHLSFPTLPHQISTQMSPSLPLAPPGSRGPQTPSSPISLFHDSAVHAAASLPGPLGLSLPPLLGPRGHSAQASEPSPPLLLGLTPWAATFRVRWVLRGAAPGPSPPTMATEGAVCPATQAGRGGVAEKTPYLPPGLPAVRGDVHLLLIFHQLGAQVTWPGRKGWDHTRISLLPGPRSEPDKSPDRGRWAWLTPPTSKAPHRCAPPAFTC